MNTRSSLFGLMLFPLLCAIALPAPAQTAKPAAPAHQQAADAAARKQLAAYLADFQNSPDDAALRNKIVELAKTMKPAPAIPQLARDTFAHAAAQMKAASSPDDFKAAARHFEQVAVQAPWYADAYYSAASAYAKAADYDNAKRNLALYLAAVHPGVDTQAAVELGRGLDRQLDEQQLQLALRQFNANPTDAARLQIIKLVQAMKNPPEIPETARGHYVMAVVLANSAEDSTGFERAIEEYKAALSAAPWWGDAYKKLAEAQKAAERFDDAIATMNLYMLTQPDFARDAQDEIYQIMALKKTADAENAVLKQREERQQKLLQDQQEKERAAAEGKNFTVEGRWYRIPVPGDFFIGGKSDPECDYFINENGGRWTITNHCPWPTWAIDKIQVRARQINFQLSGHFPGYPYSVATVTFTLSVDGKTLEGIESVFQNGTEHLGDHTVRWIRRE